jgi:hypothetical protein
MAAYSKTTVEVESSFELPFKCSACGHEAIAVVRGAAKGESYSSPIGSASKAANEARSSAEEGAARNAETVLGLVPCPKCDKRDEKALERFRKDGTMTTIAVLVAGAVMATIAWFVKENALYSVGAAGLSLAFLFIQHQERAKTMSSAASRVEFRKAGKAKKKKASEERADEE